MRRLWLSSALLVLLVPSIAYAVVRLSSAGGFNWDVYEGSDFGSVGAMGDGTSDAYDTCYRFQVGSTDYTTSGATTTALGGRQLIFPAEMTGGLSVQRIVYVPMTGGDYARYLEVLSNPGSSAVTTNVAVYGNLGSDSGTIVSGSSSGDTTVSTADTWFSTDDSGDGSGDPSLAHVLQGASATVSPSTVSLSPDNLRYEWNVTVPPGGRVAILHFAVQAMNRAASMTEARRLVEIPDDVLVGLDDYLDDIINFQIAVEGAPRVRFSGPFEADEGAEVAIEVSIEDPEGDSFEFSWDLDDDGTFGEMPGATSYTIPAGTTDGPGATRVGIRATDSAGNTSERYRTIRIVNVAPTITSEPTLLTSVGASYRYQLEVDEPAGDADPLTYTIVRGNERMTVSDTGVVAWTPTESDVTPPGEPLGVEVEVQDGDEGVATQAWDLVVSPNRAPTVPMPAYPTDRIAIEDPTPRLAASNAEDLDLDPLEYFFQIDTVDTFDSPDLRESGAVEETPGFTAWQLTEDLPVNRLFFWRVKVNDGTVDSEWSQTAFYRVGDEPNVPDAGVVGEGGINPGVDAGGGGGGGGGCSVEPRSSGSRSGWGWLAIAAAALVWVRRRRR